MTLTAAREAFRATYPGTPDQVTRARHEVAAYLAGGPVIDDALVVVSELCANAVVHSRSAHGSFGVTCEAFPSCVRIEVTDAGGSREPGIPGDGGRGLVIVGALAGEWSVDGDYRGHTVWCRLDFPHGGGK